jgi:hypothetical protein
MPPAESPESSNPTSYPEQFPSAAPEPAQDNSTESPVEPNPDAVIGEEAPHADSGGQSDSESNSATNPEVE